MNALLEADLTLLASRLTQLEERMSSIAPLPPVHVPTPLPVDKLQLADYGEEEDEEVVVQPSISQPDLQELVSAVREYMEWARPQPHLSPSGWMMVSQSAQNRLERALQPLERELKRIDNA